MLATLLALTGSSPALAWGPQGHRVIATLASERLSPEARAEIAGLLVQGDTLADIANWADHDAYDQYRDSAPWHYVNVPITATRYDARYCKRNNCVVEKIKHYRAVLANRQAPRRDRQHALLFLVHFVGDIHQPLHVGDNDDRGGNQTQIQFFDRGTNLHRVWDSDIMRHIGGSDRVWTDRVRQGITRESAREWSAGTVEDWATETLKAAKVAYGMKPGSRSLIASGASLGEDYVKTASPILREQLARAAVRLANELNAALAGK